MFENVHVEISTFQLATYTNIQKYLTQRASREAVIVC